MIPFFITRYFDRTEFDKIKEEMTPENQELLDKVFNLGKMEGFEVSKTISSERMTSLHEDLSLTPEYDDVVDSTCNYIISRIEAHKKDLIKSLDKHE